MENLNECINRQKRNPFGSGAGAARLCQTSRTRYWIQSAYRIGRSGSGSNWANPHHGSDIRGASHRRLIGIKTWRDHDDRLPD